jgi:hypothetical protein
VAVGERMILRVGVGGSEVAVPRGRMLEADLLLSYRTADFREGEDEDEDEGGGWVEGEGLEVWISEASQVASAVVVGVSLRNFHLPHHCQAVGMRNGRCYGLSSLLGLPRPPHFFKRPRNSSNLLLRIQVSAPCP